MGIESAVAAQDRVRRSGKWSVAGVPHKGWTCVAVEDLGEPSDVCEMCECQEVRFVHVMTHPDYIEELRVGCVCAGHMEADVAGAKAREAGLRSRVAKRGRWTTRKWKLSQSGNEWIKAEGYRVTVYRLSGGGWGATVAAELGGDPIRSRRFYPTKDSAKLAAFDLITLLLSRKTPGSPSR